MTSAGIIVLAEDDPRMRRLYSDSLTVAGYHVLSAGDGAEALRLLTKVTPKAVLLDIMMPRMNGIEACIRARGIVGFDVPILFLSALDRLDVLHDCLAAGADDYMIKSDSLKNLVARIQQWTRRGGDGQLAARRKKMLDKIGRKLETLGKPPAESGSDDNEGVVAAAAADAEARRALAGERLLQAENSLSAQRVGVEGACIDEVKVIQLLAASPEVESLIGSEGIVVNKLPFQVGRKPSPGESTSASAKRSELMLHAVGRHVSPLQFTIEEKDGHLTVRDLGSHLGTLVNGVRLAHFEPADVAGLRFGENRIQIGGLESPYRFAVIVKREATATNARSWTLNSLPRHPGR